MPGIPKYFDNVSLLEKAEAISKPLGLGCMSQNKYLQE